MPVRLAFLGNDPWSVPALEAIAGEPDLVVAAVVTNRPKPAGRGAKPTPTAVARAAAPLQLPLVEADGVTRGDGLIALREAAPDVVVVVAYGELLSQEVLSIGRWGAINLHLSLLPRWRGAAPVQHALLAGDEVTGVTVMRMDEGLDTGPVLTALEEAIRPDDDAGSLGARLAKLGARLLVGVLRQLPDGGLPERPQGDDGVTVAPRPGPADRILDWTRPAPEVVRRVRAFSPKPGASTTHRGAPLKVLAAAVAVDATTDGPPGAIVHSDARGVLVAAGTHAVWVLEVAPAGRRRMAAAAWANGARFTPGERLG